MKRKQHGFTLIEMAVVLLVIGLIIGGVVMGQDLLKSAERKSIISEYGEFKSAITNFRTKYKFWPGDLPDANLLRGSTAPTNAGDGNDVIGGGAIAGAAELELYYVWQHLQFAKMITGAFSTVGTENATYAFTPGTNVPLARYDRGAWNINTVNPAVTRTLYTAFTGFGIQLAAEDLRPTTHLLFSKGTTSETPTGILLAEEAEDIDYKIDDGKPGRGKLQAPNNSVAANAGCSTTNVATTAFYDVANKQPKCFLMFMHILE